MACGILGITYESHVTPYDDEQTPIQLTGKKMLPIWEDKTGAINESLDIISRLDTSKRFKAELQNTDQIKEMDNLLNKLAGPLFKLAMPYFVWTPEFDENSRKYFLEKKEAKRGPFTELLKNRATYEDDFFKILGNDVIPDIKNFYKSDKLRLWDIMLSSHLWGLYLVPELRVDQKLHDYLQRVKAETEFNYVEDYTSDKFWH
jgi:glutaredoxin 2